MSVHSLFHQGQKMSVKLSVKNWSDSWCISLQHMQIAVGFYQQGWHLLHSDTHTEFST